MTSTPKAPRSSSKPWTIAHHRTRPAVRCRPGRWRNAAPDALVDICGAYLSGSGEGTAPVNLNVTMDHGTLTGSPPEDPRQVRCELEGFGPIPLATAFRLACDCSVTRVLMRGESEVLDLGRSTRLASAAQHKALAIRDRGCVFPGCDRPARLVQRAPPRLVGTRRPHRRTEPAACCVGATTPSATKAAGASPAATTAPTKPTNHPRATSPPADTDAHRPRAR